MAMADGYSATLINIERDNISQNVLRNADPSQYIQELIRVDVPLTAKFREVNFCDILARNSESTDSLKKLIMGLNILEKYGRHLLKPSEMRSNMWRHIKYNNSIYNTRVHTLQGGREIMGIMGYSENRSDGVAFPDEVEPDQQKVLNLVVDLILGKKELETYLNGNHPHPEFIEAYIGQDIVSKLRSNSGERQSENGPPAHKIEQQAPLDFQPATLPVLSMMETISIPQQTGVPADSRVPVASMVGETGTSQVGDMGTSQVGDTGTSQQGDNSGQPVINIEMSHTSDVVIDPRPSVQTEVTESPTDTENIQSIACDICGHNRADVVCHQCDDKQLCKDCDIKWHKHPKRQNHQVDQLRQTSADVTNHTEPQNQTPIRSTGISYPPQQPLAGLSTTQQAYTPRNYQQQHNLDYQQQQQQTQHGYLHTEQPQHRSMYPQNYPEFPTGHMTSYQQQQQQYYTQRPQYSLQPHGQQVERLPQREGVTLMYDPVRRSQYEMPSLHHNQGYHIPSGQLPSHQHYTTMQDQTMPPTERHNQFQYQGHPPSSVGHMMTSNYTPQPGYIPTGPMYGTIPRSAADAHSTMSYNQGGMNYGQGQGHTSQRQSAGSTPSPITPLVSPISNSSGETNYISSRALMTGHPDKNVNNYNAPQQFVSKLLPKIKSIPDFEKRKSRLEIDLITLREDITDWDRKINDIIINYPNFFQNEEYISLNKRKRNHLHEIKELENYQKDLEEVIAEISREQNMARQAEAYREMAQQRMQEFRQLGQGQMGSPSPYQPKLNSSSSQSSIPSDPQREGTGQVLSDPNRSSYHPPVFSPGPEESTEDPLQLKLSSLETSDNEINGLPEDIRRMLVLDQSPFDKPAKSNQQVKPKQQYPLQPPVQSPPTAHLNQPLYVNQPAQFNQPVKPKQPIMPMNVPVEQHRATVDVTYPPDVGSAAAPNKLLNTIPPALNTEMVNTNQPQAHMPSGHSAPDLQHIPHPSPPTRSKSEVGTYQWECNHCTFLNDSSVKACSICSKTSDNPRKIYPMSEKSQTENETVHCHHCTFLNKKGYTACEMCGQKPFELVKKEEMVNQKEVVHREEMVPKEEIKQVEVDQLAASGKSSRRGLDDIIKNDQDQGVKTRSKRYTACEMCGQKPFELVKKEEMVHQEEVMPREEMVPREEIKQVEVDQVAASGKSSRRGFDDIIKNDQDQGYTACEICGQKPFEVVKKEEMVNQEEAVAREEMVPREEMKQVEVDQLAASGKSSRRGLDDIIKNDQDQVYWEKKAAQEEFEKMNQIGNQPNISHKAENQRSGTNQTQNQPSDNTKAGLQSSENNHSANHPSGTSENLRQSAGSSGPNTLVETEPVKHLEKPTSSAAQEKSTYESSGTTESTGSYETARNSPTTVHDDVEHKTPTKPEVKGHIPQKKGFKGSPDFTKSIEEIELKREQEQMNIHGLELIRFIKEAESADFDMEEIKIALQHCGQDDMNPTQWLKEKWMSMVKIVEDLSLERGKNGDVNHVGDISREEAKEALLKCDGDVEKAVKKCVEERLEKYQKITEYGTYGHEDILTALLQNHGDIDEAFDQLNQSTMQDYLDRIWGMRQNQLEILAHMNTEASRLDVCNSVVTDEDFQSIIKDTTIDKYRRIRMVFVEGKLKSWGRAELVISILEQNILQAADPLECTLEDIIDAVRNCRDRKTSLIYLRQECGICFAFYPMSKIRNLTVCNCKLCENCLKQCFEIAVREKFVRNWGCPICSAPGLENDDTMAADYFDFLHLLLERLVSKDVIDLFDTKLRDWNLQKDPKFRWCAHCAFGFIWDRPDTLGMTCHLCKKKTCYLCKIKWEDQHEGLTCEQFQQWKIDNDPEKQAKGVKLYLEENGIDCPGCKMRYSLAKGGCMHFKCPQCGHEFCSGCSQPFKQQGVCKLLNSCKNKGLHCHHPRDCYYYLRDNEVGELQKLLKKQQVIFNTEIPQTQEDRQHCPVMEQKDVGILKKDEACGKDVQKGHAGLCMMHYKEYLVGLINKNKIDPVTILKLNDLKILIERNEKVPPELRPNENEGQYRNRLIQFIQVTFKLQR